MAKLPLEGIRILDMTVVWAGPYAGMFLADLGAEVIRVESLQMKPMATRGTFARPSKAGEARAGNSMYPGRNPGERPWNRNTWFNGSGRNKLSMTVNLNTPRGKDIFRKLVEISDGFIENNAAGAMDRLGIGYETLKQWNSKLIMASASGTGATGPWIHHRGWGNHFEATYGHAGLIGYPDLGPDATPSNVSTDAAGGVGIAFGLIMALHNRQQTGEGQFLDLSLGENFLPHVGEIFMDYTMNGRVAGKLGNRHPVYVQGAYPCMGKDEWIAITIATDEQWRALCNVMKRPELAGDERFATLASRHQNHDEVDEVISSWTKENDNYWLFYHLQKAKVPSGPVQWEDEAYKCPHLWERRFFIPETQEDLGTYLYPGTVYKASKMPLVAKRGPVRLGEDNEYVYKELLKVSDEEYADLEATGHVGMDYLPEVP